MYYQNEKILSTMKKLLLLVMLLSSAFMFAIDNDMRINRLTAEIDTLLTQRNVVAKSDSSVNDIIITTSDTANHFVSKKNITNASYDHEYQRFLDNTSWLEGQRGLEGECFFTMNINTNRDTIIYGKTYRIIQSTNGIIGFPLKGMYKDVNTHNRYFREDVSSMQVAEYDDYHGEQLLYDFSVNEGDTVFNGNVVKHIMLKEVNGIKRKHIIFDSGNDDKPRMWIEGIGSVCGMRNYDSPDWFRLTCVKKGDEEMYEDSFLDGRLQCDIDNEIKIDRLFVSTQYTNNDLWVLSDSGVTEIWVYNSSGKCVKQISANNNKEVEIDVSSFPTGIYILHAKANNGDVIKEKFIKQ